jgi:hypothetical protein
MALGVLVDQVYRDFPDAEAWWDHPINGITPAKLLEQGKLDRLRRMVEITIRERVMLTQFTEKHFSDTNGNPAGGSTFGPGFAIAWQNGPLGRDAERIEPNGAFVETVIKAAVGRLNYYQSSRFNCSENACAIEHLEAALLALNSRTSRRESQKIEGTHEGN